MAPVIKLHQKDLPENVIFQGSVAIDTEAMGLNPHRDRLCLVQLSAGDGICHLVQVNQDKLYQSPRLCALLENPQIIKIFHFARFDVAILQHTYGIRISSIYCTKIASKLTRTFTEKHGLKDLCKDLLGVEISKEQQTSDWGHPDLKDKQRQYAATDVLYLHQLKGKLDVLLERENRRELAEACFKFLPTCADLDLLGYSNLNLFEH